MRKGRNLTTKTTRESVWKKIEGYQDKYSVSNLGYVRNDKTGKILKPGRDISRYLQVSLRDSIKKKAHTFKIHRLVAINFLQKDKERLQVNHLDGNKENNQATNLEWCTCGENARHAERLGLRGDGGAIRVGQFTLKGKLIETFLSISIAAKETGVPRSSICHCLSGRYKMTGGYGWRRVEGSRRTKPKERPMGASQWKKHGNKYGYWKYFVEKERVASTPPPAKSVASVKTPNQHEQREQALRKSIESILFANGVKCDEEQFLIEDIEHLLSKERETLLKRVEREIKTETLVTGISQSQFNGRNWIDKDGLLQALSIIREEKTK